MTSTRAHFSTRPDAGEYDFFYQPYLNAAPAGDVIESLRDQSRRLLTLFKGLDAGTLSYRYKPEKWTVKEVLGHVTDSERIFSYRALRFARADQTELPGMDQNVFVQGADFESRPIHSVLAEFEGIRMANVALFGAMDSDVLDLSGTASSCRFTVRSLIWIILGHCEHHLGVLRDRYLSDGL